MRSNFFSRRFAVALALCVACGAAWADVNPKPFVVPEVKTWQGAEGATQLSGRVIAKSAKLASVAEALAKDYGEMFGRQLTVATGKAQNGDIVLTLGGDKKLGAEGYTLAAGETVEIAAPTQKGVFWATRTLLQIAEQNGGKSLPKGNISDTPEYPLRGFMIDCGRKYIPIAYLRNLAKVMAYYKMNLLQVHLNDNGFRQFFGNDWDKTPAAWRLECSTFPGLTAKDGSYTKKEFVDFQKLAEENFVEILPEIDAPAHSLAFTHFKPEIGSKEYGMDHLDLFNPETYTFMDALWKEYIGGSDPVFRGPRVHIGTDEYSNAKKDVVEKFREFTDHYIKFVEGYGKKAVVWGALTHANGDTPVKSKDVLMDIWYNGYADPVEMRKQGYKLVCIPDGLTYIVPAAGYYYDYLNCQYLYEHWTPATIGNKQFPENDPAIEGGMFAVWNDHAGNGISVKDIHHRVFPALQTIAAKTWAGKRVSLSYKDFDEKRASLSEAPGVNELARHGKPGTVALSVETVIPGSKQKISEIGYNYSVSFHVDGVNESKGAALFTSPNATFYLSDPKEGKLGFERDGYLNTFNYRVEKGKSVTIAIEGDNRETRLYVDGQLKEKLSPKTLYVMRDKDRAHYQTAASKSAEPEVYDPTEKIYYQRTLVFPLEKAGNFKSRVTKLEVKVKE